MGKLVCTVSVFETVEIVGELPSRVARTCTEPGTVPLDTQNDTVPSVPDMAVVGVLLQIEALSLLVLVRLPVTDFPLSGPLFESITLNKTIACFGSAAVPD